MKYIIILSFLFLSCDKSPHEVLGPEVETQSYVFSHESALLEELSGSRIHQNTVEGNSRFLISTNSIKGLEGEKKSSLINLKYLVSEDQFFIDFGYRVKFNNQLLTRTRYSNEVPIRVEYNDEFDSDDIIPYESETEFSLEDSKHLFPLTLSLSKFPKPELPNNLSFNSTISLDENLNISFDKILNKQNSMFGFYIKKPNFDIVNYFNIQFSIDAKHFEIDKRILNEYFTDYLNQDNQIYFYIVHTDPNQQSISVDLKNYQDKTVSVPLTHKSFNSFQIKI